MIFALWPLLLLAIGSAGVGAWIYDEATGKDHKNTFTVWDGIKVLTVAGAIWISVAAYKKAR